MTRVLDKRIWVLIWTAIGIPFSWIKEVKDVGLVIVIIVASADKMITDGIPEDLAVLRPSPLDFLASLASYFFAYSFTATSPTVCYHMNRPMDFPKMLVAAVLLITLLYMSVMELGYAAYGQSLSEVDTIVDAISPPGQPLDVFGWLINIVILMVMLPHFLVLFTPTAKQIDVLCSYVGERRQWSSSHTKVACLVGRTCLVIVDGCIALVVPKVSSLVSLVGALCVTQISILFPIACYIKIKRQHRYPFPKWEVPLLVLLFVIGLVVTVIGLYGAILHF
ncbi:hypothetical protein FOZ63_030848 [Perkinsus olseni]|uniref:Amino acid transporter transmembrane domain-containing protein n=1 Tax=Perkinsus olseni TaxID=32597 RepID=A0A7J6R3C9_PEROL|nr:hypothetical protein FOZ63_030848 [Perkinsus olseni]KAF4751043.1 hypothetical protein FOZ62_026598 [Perkinsus olseni]